MFGECGYLMGCLYCLQQCMVMDDGVWIFGGYQSDFVCNFSKENCDFVDLIREVVDGMFIVVKVDVVDLVVVGVVYVVNVFGEMFVC